MRAAKIPVYAITLTLIALSSLSTTVQPSDIDERTRIAILCGTITDDTWIFDNFYITCLVSVEAGVELHLAGAGYADPYGQIDVYGNLFFSADVTWNTTSPPDPYDWRWGGIRIFPSGHIDANGFSIKHTLEAGIVIYGSSNNSISNGWIEDVDLTTMTNGHGIGLRGSDNNIIDKVRITDTVVGVDINDGMGNVVMNSGIFSNGDGVRFGIYTDPTNHNTIVCNEFENNAGHIVGLGSGDNTIHHNNFLDFRGPVIAWDEYDLDQWDDGYPSGGNYWVDYGGNDSFRGPDQNFPGSDGIGDEPYSIPDLTGMNMDRYPLMNPVQSGSCPSPPPQMPLGPLPPYNLLAELEGSSLSDVNVSWNLSWNDRDPEFQNYAIYFSQGFTSDGTGYDFLTDILPGRDFFVHNGAGHGNPSNYFYYVQANDTSGYPGKSYEQVGKFAQELQNGWNLISIPLMTIDMQLESILQTLTFERVKSYNALTCTWEEYHTSKPYQGSWPVALNQGLWIEISSEGNMTIAGIVPDPTTMNLVSGWNLVSYPSFVDREVSVSLSEIPFERVEGFDSTNPPYYLRQLFSSDTMTPGNAYWIKVSSPCTWTVSN